MLTQEQHDFINRYLNIDYAPLGQNAAAFQEILGNIITIPDIQALLIQAHLKGKVTVSFVPNNTLQTGGVYLSMSHCIQVAADVTTIEVLGTFLFELANAANRNFDNHRLNQFSVAECYALATEQIEFETVMRAKQAYQAILNAPGMVPLISNAANSSEYQVRQELSAYSTINNFDDCLALTRRQRANQSKSHFELYMDSFYRRNPMQRPLSLDEYERAEQTQFARSSERLEQQRLEQQRLEQQRLEQQPPRALPENNQPAITPLTLKPRSDGRKLWGHIRLKPN